MSIPPIAPPPSSHRSRVNSPRLTSNAVSDILSLNNAVDPAPANEAQVAVFVRPITQRAVSTEKTEQAGHRRLSSQALRIAVAQKV